MAEEGHPHYCLQCGQEVGPEDRFCNNCGYSLSVPPPGEGRIETGQVNVPPPPSDYQRSGPGVWSGVKIFFGGCIVLPILILIFVFIVLPFFGALVGGGG